MKMKKTHMIFWLAVGMTVLLLMTACTKSGTEASETAGDSDEPKLRIGVSLYKPYYYVDENGDRTGIDEEIAEEACRRIGYEPDFTEIVWGEQDGLLERGRIDCIWGRFSINGREDDYLWTAPYLYSPVTVVVRADSDILGLSDLEGKKVAVLAGSVAEKYFLKEIDQEGVSIEEVRAYGDMEQAFTAFDKGYADAIVSHMNGLKTFTEDNEQLYRYFDHPLYVAQLGVAFKKNGNQTLVDKLTQVLNDMNTDGTIQAIARRYGLDESCIVEGSIE